MHRIDDSKFLLYIEPKKEEKLENPINDEIVEIMRLAWSEAKKGAANYSDIDKPEYFSEEDSWRGFHTTDCGLWSSNCDYLLKNGMITNNLCVFYLQYYRNSIPASEMKKVMELISFYNNLK